MLQKTKGIVLHTIKYSESSIIARVYTEAFGLQSYLIKGARSRKAALRSSMFQPLTLLDMEVYHRGNSDLQHIREAGVSEPFHAISSDIRKSSVAIFLAEVLFRSLKETEANEELFGFLSHSLHFFDMQEEGIEYFHLYFLIRLSRFLGFLPQGEPLSDKAYFDLREGKFIAGQAVHPDQVSEAPSLAMWKIMNTSAGELQTLSIRRNTRDELLDALIIYYQIHLSGLGTIKSLEVLREVFR